MTTVDLVPLLKNVTKGWLDTFKKIDPQLRDLSIIMKKVELETYYPPKEDVFHFAKFSKLDLKFVILGMDPYPEKGDAHGLSFSTLRSKAPASLARIHSLLKSNKLLENPTNDLTFWALQGALLLNTALTVGEKRPGSHIACWSPWMDRLIKEISESTTGLTWCLWGSHAQAKANLIGPQHQVLRWCHPVSPSSPSFSLCDHFLVMAAKWPKFIWDFTKSDTDFFTDCCAKGNGRRTCNASWAVLCTKGLWDGRSWSDRLETLTDSSGAEVKPTNIRAEGMAIKHALMLASLVPNGINITIYTDSQFWIDMLTIYIPKWVVEGQSIQKRKNYDIIQPLWSYYRAVKATLKLIWVGAWHDRAEPTDPIDHYKWVGNRDVEAIAIEKSGET